MDTNSFYATVTISCFALVGLWWGVVQGRTQWRDRPELRRLGSGVYQSFLIPGLMSMGAQLTGDNGTIWRGVFVTAAIVGGLCTLRLLQVVPASARGLFGRHRWVILVLYALIGIVGLFPELAREIELEPLQAEGLLIVALMLAGHALAWEFMYGPAETAEAVEPAQRDTPGGWLPPAQEPTR